jgi:mono/diheme cytochrome c family protein
MMGRTAMRSLSRGLLVLAAVSLLLSAAGQPQDEGRRIFTGRGFCASCHGPAGRGTPLGPDLADGEWLHVAGTVESLDSLIRAGVPRPKRHPVPMPPRGGARLSDAEVRAVAVYVHGLGNTP